MTQLVRRPTDEDGAVSTDRTAPRRIDVTDLDAAGVTAYVERNVETDCVSLETRGTRTYLVVGE